MTDSTDDGSAARAHSSAAARSRDRSPVCVCTCMPSRIERSDRVNAAAAPGSTLATVTDGMSARGSIRVSGALAAGRNSRSAISSVSAASPAKGRVTIRSAASADPWQAL